MKDKKKLPVHAKYSDLLEQRLHSPTVMFVLGAAIIGGLVYLWFLFKPEYRGDLLPYLIVIIAESYLVLQGILSFWTIISGKSNPRNFEYHAAQDVVFGRRLSKTVIKHMDEQTADSLRELPLHIGGQEVTIDVFIPTYGEALDDVRSTAVAARNMYGKHETYVLDDGDSDAVRDMAKEVGVGYIRRTEHVNAKAGNVNHALGRTSGELFVVLDADFIAKPEFLYETVPFFENTSMAMVQTPQYYSNALNFVSKGASYMQHVFYSMVMAGKNRFNAAFCVGTCVVFRRSAIEEIGGMYSESKSEDIWTSLKLHENNWKSVYINKVLAIGKTPETIKAFSKQQLRWATGSFEILLKRNPLFNRNLTNDQRLQYFMTTIFYLNGFAVLGLLILPALQIFFNISPIATDVPLWQWIVLYSGFYLMQLFLSVYVQGGIKLETIMISAAAFPIYIKAFFNALFGRDQAWDATNVKDSRYDSPFNYVHVQVYAFIFLLLTSGVGVWKIVYTQEFSIAVVWNLINTIILGVFIKAIFKEAHELKKQLKEPATERTVLRKEAA